MFRLVTGSQQLEETEAESRPNGGINFLDFGNRMLPQVVDELAKLNPERIYASIPVTSEVTHGFRDISIMDLSQAVNGFAWWLDARMSRRTKFETLAYMGLPDLRYAIVFLAAVKCGYKVSMQKTFLYLIFSSQAQCSLKLLVPSPRNSIATNVSLLEQTECTKILLSEEMLPRALGFTDAVANLECIQVTSQDDMFNAASRPYPFDKTFENAKLDPVLILHSSGSTGMS